MRPYFGRFLMAVACMTLAFGLAACGGGGGSSSDGKSGSNSAPVADAGPDRNVATGSLVTLDGSGSYDADGDTLTYGWSFISRPDGSTAALSDPTVVNPTFTPDKDGQYVVQLIVNDGTVGGEPDTVTITAERLITLPDTGQTTCYDSNGDVIDCAGTGQDGEFLVNPPSYTDNSDGTVTDDVTDLTWQQCSAGQSGADCSGEAAQQFNWYEATGTADDTYNPGGATDVCGDLSLGGYSDWRLPTVKELESITITHSGKSEPSIDSAVFPNTQWSLYWSSTTDAGGASFAWYVDFGYGYVSSDGKEVNGYVRCVRGPSPSAPSFTDNEDGTATDNLTGLMWQQEDDDIHRLWQDALDYCNGLALAGHDDWRLPNIKELRSIVDSSAYSPAIDAAVFPGTNPDNGYWSSTTYRFSLSYAWYADFSNGLAGIASKSFNAKYVRCVR